MLYIVCKHLPIHARPPLSPIPGARRWLAQKVVKRLLGIKGQQDRAVNNLLDTMSKVGSLYHERLLKMNEADAVRFEETEKQSQNVAAIKRGNEVVEQGWKEKNTDLTSNQKKPHRQSPPVPAPEYTLPTSPGFEFYPDDDEMHSSPAQKIRSIPSHGRSDDIILVMNGSRASNNPTDGDEIYENTTSLMLNPPPPSIVQDGDEIYENTASLMLNPPPPSIVQDGDEIYDDPASLMLNPPPPSIVQDGDEIYDDTASLMLNPPPPSIVQDGDEIYDDTASLMLNPPPPTIVQDGDEIYENTASLMLNPPPPSIVQDGDEIYDNTASLMLNPPPPSIVQDGDEIYENNASLMQIPPVQIYDDIDSALQRPRSATTPPESPVFNEEVYQDAASVFQRPPPTLDADRRWSHGTRSPSPTPPPIPTRSANTRISVGEKRLSLPPPIPPRSPCTKVTQVLQQPFGIVPDKSIPPPLPPRSPDTRITTRKQTPPASSYTPPLPPRKQSLSNSPSQRQRRESGERMTNGGQYPTGSPSQRGKQGRSTSELMSEAERQRVTNLPSQSFQRRLGNVLQGPLPANQSPPRSQGRRSSEPNTVLHTPTPSTNPQAIIYEDPASMTNIPTQTFQRRLGNILQGGNVSPVQTSKEQKNRRSSGSDAVPAVGVPKFAMQPRGTPYEEVVPTPPSVRGMPYEEVTPAVRGTPYEEVVPTPPSVRGMPYETVVPTYAAKGDIHTVPPPPSNTGSGIGSQSPRLRSVSSPPPEGHPFNPSPIRQGVKTNQPVPPPPPPPPPLPSQFSPPAMGNTRPQSMQHVPPAPVVSQLFTPLPTYPSLSTFGGGPAPPPQPPPPSSIGQVGAPPPPPPPPIGVPPPPPPPPPPIGHRGPAETGAPAPPPPPPLGGLSTPRVRGPQARPKSMGAELSSGPPQIGDLLAGLSNVKLRKAEDRVVPGKQVLVH